MDITTATPVEIDTALAALWQKRYALMAKRDHAWNAARDYITYTLKGEGILTGFVKASSNQVTEFLLEYEEISEQRALQEQAFRSPQSVRYAASAWEQHLTFLHHAEQADDVLLEIEPLDEEYVRRGRWNRAFLVSNSNGHVHRSMDCGTCYPTTQYHWVTEYSDKSEEEIVEAAGERACTVCYPSAPVETLSRPTQMFTPDEVAKQQARDERAQKKAEREAAQITVKDYRDGTRVSDKVFKTTRAVTNDIVSNLTSLEVWGSSHPSASVWTDNVNAAVRALKEKGIEYDLEAAILRTRKKVASGNY